MDISLMLKYYHIPLIYSRERYFPDRLIRQCILRGGLPFAVEIPQYNQTTLDAMAEARRISRDPDVKGYTSMADLKAALESDD